MARLARPRFRSRPSDARRSRARLVNQPDKHGWIQCGNTVERAMKHVPFQSNYRPDFEVVEERRGNLSLYPHTEQLPLLLRALNAMVLKGLWHWRGDVLSKDTDAAAQLWLQAAKKTMATRRTISKALQYPGIWPMNN